MNIIGIDPGNIKSAYVFYEPDKHIESGYVANEHLLQILCRWADVLVIEGIKNMGMLVGQTVFDTCEWIGRFEQKRLDEFPEQKVEKIFRHDIKMHLCGSMRATDSNIRRVLIDRFPPVGGGKIPQIGTKKKPGLLYGIKGDIWSALAVTVTYAEIKMHEK